MHGWPTHGWSTHGWSTQRLSSDEDPSLRTFRLFIWSGSRPLKTIAGTAHLSVGLLSVHFIRVCGGVGWGKTFYLAPDWLELELHPPCF